MKKVKIGTRDSELALWQADRIAALLEMAGLETETCPISTKGDKVLNVSLHKIGSKGLFTEELDEMLRQGEIHLAVHSAKDVQSHLAEDMELIAFSEREFAGDVLVAFQPMHMREANERGLTIGTSSTRRRACVMRHYPQIRLKEVRGNLQTRLRKMEEGNYDGLLLAFAGVHRMDQDHLVREKLHFQEFTPPVGQGSMAIQVSTELDDQLRETIRKACNHEATERCIRTERQMLYSLNGGCSVPLFGHCTLDDHGQLHMRGGVLSLNGKTQMLAEATGESPEIGLQVAESLKAEGAEELLEDIRAQLQT